MLIRSVCSQSRSAELYADRLSAGAEIQAELIFPLAATGGP
jgi:hypothetical protein